jgi:hypothetical protein
MRWRTSPTTQLLQITKLLSTYARCALYYKMYHFLAQRLSWQGRHCRSPVASLSDALSFKCCTAKFSDKHVSGASSVSSLHAPSERVAAQPPFGGSLQAAPKPPWPSENFISPFGIPSTISLRPTLRRLDIVSVSALNPDHCFASGWRLRKRPWMHSLNFVFFLAI